MPPFFPPLLFFCVFIILLSAIQAESPKDKFSQTDWFQSALWKTRDKQHTANTLMFWALNQSNDSDASRHLCSPPFSLLLSCTACPLSWPLSSTVCLWTVSLNTLDRYKMWTHRDYLICTNWIHCFHLLMVKFNWRLKMYHWKLDGIQRRTLCSS